MSKESMNLGEGFQAQVKRQQPPEPPEIKPRHMWLGWALIAAMLGGGGYFLGSQLPSHSDVMKEKPGFQEILGKKFGGVLYYDIIRAALGVDRQAWGAILNPFDRQYEQTHFGPFNNQIVNEGENVLEDCFENNTGSACTNVANFEFHGIGTSSTAIGETDGGCLSEATTQYNPDNTRATGTQTNNGSNVYRTVGTNTVDASITVEEFCLMDVNTGAGNMWTRILTGTVSLGNGDGLQTTYDLTIE